jgi:ferredoxin
MPKVSIPSKKIELEVPEGTNLRECLRREGVEVYQGLTRYVNCFGHGTCGECRLLVKKGNENLSGKGILERLTLFRMFSTIGNENEMRLSCQCTVKGDVEIEPQPEMNISGETFWAKPWPNK